MRIAYLTTRYPSVSHTFIRRELHAIERCGHDVLRLAIRPPETPPIDAIDSEEMSRTIHFTTQPLLRIATAVAITLICRPWSAIRAAGRALRMGWHSERGVLRNLAYLIEAAFFLRVLERHGVQHVHVHFGTNPATVAYLIRTLKGPGYSFTVHGPAEFDSPRSLQLGRKQADAKFVIAITNYCAAQLRRWSEPHQWNKIHVVRCGLDDVFLGSPPPIDPQSRTLLCIGRLCEQKGQALLVRAFASLVEDHPDARLVLAGDGPMRPDIEKLIARHKLAGRVTITGWINGQQVRELLGRARAFVLPSFAEGLPIVLMEAMALGRPVITTYVAGIPELVQHNRTGWLIPAGDAVALTRAIRRVLECPHSLLQEMGMRGHRRVQRLHDVARQASRLDSLFNRYMRNGHMSPVRNAKKALS